MRNDLVDRLYALAEEPVPGPDPAFMARLGSDLRHLDQVPVLSERRPPVRRLPWGRLVAIAVPVGALALASAFVALRPAPAHPHQVRTAGPGVTSPAPPESGAIEAGDRQAPPTTAAQASGGNTSHPATNGTITTPPKMPTTESTPSTEPTRYLVVPAPDSGPSTTVAPTPRSEPTTTTTAAPPPVSPETVSLHCTTSATSGTPAVSCTWSASTVSAFKSYRLSREKPGTNRVIVFTSDNRTTTTYTDYDVQAGTGYGYWIEVLDASGNVIGRGATTVSCC
jgi:hypothetical protein